MLVVDGDNPSLDDVARIVRLHDRLRPIVEPAIPNDESDTTSPKKPALIPHPRPALTSGSNMRSMDRVSRKPRKPVAVNDVLASECDGRLF